MASDIGSVKNKVRRFRPWDGQWTIAHRILALNLLILVVFAVSVLYLDAFRNQLQDERTGQLQREAQLISGALSAVPEAKREALLARLSAAGNHRARLYAADGALLADSWRSTGPTYELRDPASEKWRKSVARALDRGFNALVGARQITDFVEPAVDRADAWPELRDAKASGKPAELLRNAPDLTPVYSVGVETSLEHLLSS